MLVGLATGFGVGVGVAFGAVTAGLPAATITGAIALAIGIGIQNFPEGVAVSGPLRREGLSRFKCFWYGQLSGIVEPVAGVLGAAAVLAMRPLLPYALSFAAGAMIYVVVEELIPESQREQANIDLVTMATMAGFMPALMMLLTFGLLFGGNTAFPVAVVNYDTGAYGDLLIETMAEVESPFGDPYYSPMELSEEEASVGLREVSEESPFFHLEGSDNLVLIRTTRYKDNPLIIRGPGAGPEVTAGGLVKDIVKFVDMQDY